MREFCGGTAGAAKGTALRIAVYCIYVPRALSRTRVVEDGDVWLWVKLYMRKRAYVL